ncbi:MAG: hypothetical protein MR773_01860 [Eubacterium coprostanoligenes]|nr:hypothetical protein [Eubacterium coprostanoligenes]
METDYMGMISMQPQAPKPKIPVEITLTCNTQGKMNPLFLKWKTGCIYKIDDILDIKPRGTNRVDYKVMINGRKTNHYYIDKLWLVDEKG